MVGHAADHLICFIIIQALLSEEKLPPLDGILVGGKTLQYSKFALCLPRYCLSSLSECLLLFSISLSPLVLCLSRLSVFCPPLPSPITLLILSLLVSVGLFLSL